jgi:crotonobetainyl-CoA:carnitine CoA-transferase CaiB-like acyl-CoA transferase
MTPLANIKVIEFGNFATAPFCGMLLADMGADVIKVENPAEGDGLREWPPFAGNMSVSFAALNRNKRSVACNLKDPVEAQRVRELIRTADVVIENFRPGTMARFGLDYETFKPSMPSLIYCSISAYGQTGPRAQEGGFDLTLQAASGIMSVTGDADGPPVKCGVPISDFAAGVYAAFAVSSALHAVSRGAPGVYIDISMLGASLAFGALQTSAYFGSNVDPVRLGAAHPRNAPYEAFAASDGHIVIAAGNDKLFARLCEVLSLEHLPAQERFSSVRQRAANQAALKAVLEENFAQRCCKDLVALITAAGVPCANINSYSQILADPQVLHLGLRHIIRLSSGEEIETVGSIVRLDGQFADIYRDPPRLGDHNAEVFSQNGPPPPNDAD